MSLGVRLTFASFFDGCASISLLEEYTRRICRYGQPFKVIVRELDRPGERLELSGIEQIAKFAILLTPPVRGGFMYLCEASRRHPLLEVE